MDKPAILIFGLGELQRSLIEQCKKLGLFTVGLDITENAPCRNDVNAFEVAAGDDYNTTLEIAQKYHVAGVITTATDKPLVMMAKIAEALHLPFYSVQTALWCTDKLKMKQHFQVHDIPCASGMEISTVSDLDKISWDYPVVVKPRDNSGSRGVILCKSRQEAEKKIAEAFNYTRQETILVEEFIDGQEYSVESLHYRGKTHIIQYTQKITSEFPYNVELGHIQPAGLTEEQEGEIHSVIAKIATAMDFDNCASHTELKINGNQVIVIETSPRLGGDFITSALTPLSTGINIEQLLVKMSVGIDIDDNEFRPTLTKSSGIMYFELPEGTIRSSGDMGRLFDINGCKQVHFDKKVGDPISKITNSLNRYGCAIFQNDNREQIKQAMKKAKEEFRMVVEVERE